MVQEGIEPRGNGLNADDGRINAGDLGRRS